MAKYRQIHTEFWSDGFVLDLTPEEKYFYIYLMTNSKTTQCGIYELPKRIVETETGYNRETVEKLLERFEHYNKIRYCNETKEIIILNWIKYNKPISPNAIKCVNKEIKSIKNRDFVKFLYDECKCLQLDMEKLFSKMEDGFISMEKNNEINSSLQGVYKDIGSNKIINNKEEVISNKEEVVEVISNNGEMETDAATFETVLLFFKDNIHKPTQTERKQLMSWTRTMSCDVIILAIQEAVNYNARFIKYIDKILLSWMNKGLTTVNKVKDYQRYWEENRVKGDKKSSGAWDYVPQREYNFQELERKLLGFDKE